MSRPKTRPPEKFFGIGPNFNEYRTEPWASRLRNAIPCGSGDDSSRVAARRAEKAKKRKGRTDMRRAF